MTLYEVLQITESAPPEIVRAAYLALAKKYHPDLCRDNPEKAAENMKIINAAYAILSDPNKRSSYDLYLKSQRRQREEAASSARTQYTRPDPTPEPPQKNEDPKQQPAHTSKPKMEKGWIAPLITLFLILALPTSVYILGNIWTASQTQDVQTTQSTLQKPDIIPTNSPSKDETQKRSDFWDDYEAKNTLQPISEPATGTLLSGYEPYNASQISVTASHTSSCLVKLKDVYDNEVLSFYVRSGETAVVDVPRKDMYVFFASGKTWYGIEHLFGENTYYSKDDTELDFSYYSWEYTLYPVEDGNFTQTTIDAEEFNQ